MSHLLIAEYGVVPNVWKCSRKATMKAHPDKGGSEAKMATVNEAYEVLSNPGTLDSS